MSKPFQTTSNALPMTERCKLISVATTVNADGYETTRTETETEIWCGFANGVSRTEYYEAMKAGVRLTATAEIWEDDFSGQRILTHDGKRYLIGRTWPTGRGTIQLYLEEVRR